MKLYGHVDSGHAYKVRLALVTAGVPHDYEVVDIWQPLEQRAPAFRAASRFGEVPCLVEDGVARVQSNAILIHLMDEHGVAPVDARRRTSTLEWLLWEANKIGLCLPQLRVARHFSDPSYNAGAIEWLQARYDSDVARLERELSDGRAFITGDTPCVADFSLCGYLVFADQAEVLVPAAVTEWLARVAALPNARPPAALMTASG